MLEVVFNKSTKASMRQSKHLRKGASISRSFFDIVYIGDNLDIGDISGKINGSERREAFDKLWSKEYMDEGEREKDFSENHKDMYKLISAAKNRGNIRIWKGNSPAEACGFAFVCNLLEDIECNINLVSLPEYIVRDDYIVESHIDWNSINSQEFHNFLSYERKLSRIEKGMYSGLWKELKLENAPLRAIVNGSLISVPDDFYDHLIFKSIPEGEFTMYELIGRVIGKHQIGVSDLWYALRINKMIEEEILEVVSVGKLLLQYKTILKISK